MIIEGTEEQFNELISDSLVLVDFHATWCGPCRMLGPILESITNETEIKIVKIDVDKCENLAKTYGVMSVPTLLLFKNQELIKKHTGLMSRDDLIKWIEENR